MERKYYTPTIEEFHVGFEYENLRFDEQWKLAPNGGTWYTKTIANTYELKEVFNRFDENYLHDIDTNEANYRVKLLDREDIESLGFTSLHETSFRFKNVFHLEINETYLHISDTSYNGTRVVFDGVIKNKSELQKLMIQLEIK